MTQTQSEGTAGDRQRRRRLKPDGHHLPLHLKFTWSKYAAWNPTSHIEISQRASPELAGDNRWIRIIPVKHTLSIYVQYGY